MPFFFLILLLFSHAVLSAEKIQFNSHGHQPQLIQLFTSQGCSSCPPAEHYLNQFIHDQYLWKNKIPMAFHVDYWNYLGWNDPFSNKANNHLQYEYKRQGHVKSVYTPSFMIDGKEWRSFFGIKRLPSPQNNVQELVATIKNKQLTVDYSITSQPFILTAVILGSNITTTIKSGENKGKKLTQHFVVLGKSTIKSQNGHWQLPLPSLLKSNAKRFALAIWITTPSSLNPVQATGGWLPSAVF